MLVSSGGGHSPPTLRRRGCSRAACLARLRPSPAREPTAVWHQGGTGVGRVPRGSGKFPAGATSPRSAAQVATTADRRGRHATSHHARTGFCGDRRFPAQAETRSVAAQRANLSKGFVSTRRRVSIAGNRVLVHLEIAREASPSPQRAILFPERCADGSRVRREPAIQAFRALTTKNGRQERTRRPLHMRVRNQSTSAGVAGSTSVAMICTCSSTSLPV